MDKSHPEANEPSFEKRLETYRAGVTDADATGMVADEEAIAHAETLAPLLAQRPPFPQTDLHAALAPEHEAHAAIDELHSRVEASTPNRQSIEAQVAHLRSFPELEALVANWWDSPAMQRFIWNLTQIGL
jgi:hypothetical protein